MNIQLTRTRNTDLDVPVSDYTITGLRTTRGREGTGFTGTLKRGKTVLGEVEDWGDGGGTWLRGNPGPAEQALLDAWVAAHPPLTGFTGEPMDYSLDLALGMLAEDIMMGRELSRKAKKHTIFVLPGEQPSDGYRALTGGPVSPGSLAYLSEKFPGQAVRVWTADRGWVPADTAVMA